MDFFYDSDDVILERKPLEKKHLMPCQLCPMFRPGQPVAMLERTISISRQHVACMDCLRIRRNERARERKRKLKLCESI